MNGVSKKLCMTAAINKLPTMREDSIAFGIPLWKIAWIRLKHYFSRQRREDKRFIKDMRRVFIKRVFQGHSNELA